MGLLMFRFCFPLMIVYQPALESFDYPVKAVPTRTNSFQQRRGQG